MDIFSGFCNICYKVNDGNLKNISEDNLKHLKDILITFVGHADIVKHNEIYLCQLCCDELTRFEKFKEMCFNNLIQFRPTYFNMLSQMKVENDSAVVKNTLKRFLHENVLRRNCLEKSNCSVSISTEHHEIVKSSEDFNTNKSVFNKHVINLQSQRNGSEFDGDCSDVSDINNVTECGETLDAITIQEDIKNEMMSFEEIKLEIFKSESNEDFDVSNINNANAINNVTECDETISSEEIKSEQFESESKEDFDLSDINNADVRDTSKIEFTKEEFDLNNAMERCHPELFKLNNFENELGEHVNSDLKIPVVNSGSDHMKQELHVKQENSGLEGLQLETTEAEFGGGLNVSFEIANVRTIVNMEYRTDEDIRSEEARDGMKLESGECNNKSITSIMNSQQSRPRVLQHLHGRCPTSLTSGLHNRVNPAVCNESVRTKRYLIVHKRTHSGEKLYKCTICKKAFIQLCHLITHKRIHSDDKPYKCIVCNKAYKTSISLKIHERLHSGERPYECTFCNKAFKRSGALTEHERIHSGERPYKCTVCNKAFRQTAHLIVHQRIHRDKPYKCTVCNKAFRTVPSLTVHNRIHSGERPYKCTMCNKAFRRPGTLASHKLIHSDEKPYKCIVCNKSFRRPSEFTMHKRLHSDDMLYKCTVCNKAFMQPARLIVHQRVHSGDKPYKCTVCNKTFAQSSNLVVHQRIHSGDKPYKCNVCNMTFRQSWDLNRHTRIHSGERP